MVIQVRDDDDGIRLALGRCGKSIRTYSTVQKGFALKSKELQCPITVRLKTFDC